MSSIYTEIRSALESHLNDASGLPAIAWQNVDYKPTTGTPFIKFQFQPTLREPAVMGNNPQQYYQGICTFLLHYPENAGPGASQAVVDTLVERFESTTDITFSTFTLTVSFAQQESPYSNPPWFVTPVTVGWYIYN